MSTIFKIVLEEEEANWIHKNSLAVVQRQKTQIKKYSHLPDDVPLTMSDKQYIRSLPKTVVVFESIIKTIEIEIEYSHKIKCNTINFSFTRNGGRALQLLTSSMLAKLELIKTEYESRPTEAFSGTKGHTKADYISKTKNSLDMIQNLHTKLKGEIG